MQLQSRLYSVVKLRRYGRACAPIRQVGAELQHTTPGEAPVEAGRSVVDVTVDGVINVTSLSAYTTVLIFTLRDEMCT